MKIRNGFVSNSSSCSFTIWGIHFYDEIPFDEKEILEKEGLDTIHGEYDEYAGLLISGENEHEPIGIITDDNRLINIKEEKLKVVEIMNKLYPDKEVSLHSEGWFNG